MDDLELELPMLDCRASSHDRGKCRGDGIARIHGLDEVMAGELVEFEEGTIGIALYLESNNVGVVLMGDGLLIQEGSSVKATGRIAQIPVSEAYLGRVVNALAKPIDGRGEISASEFRLIESAAPAIFITISLAAKCVPWAAGTAVPKLVNGRIEFRGYIASAHSNITVVQIDHRLPSPFQIQFNAVSTCRIKIRSGNGAFDSRSGTFSKFSLLNLKILKKYDLPFKGKLFTSFG
ncbi:hypothetical protein RND71_003798 [Anisodus tanguticus]|uniref:ATPase F1/V1/A1 complex alpha/beta subunit N-terminal domain-containing protein n=1 Tax=Anisodus tanguticus TaxID=243964 RepID=A0AAE1SWM1_9SOLA|nr:hypothetical protein RND71_003798 [Anisodus tanguticus]